MLAVLAAYLPFPDLDLIEVYMLFGSILGVFLVLVVVRLVARMREGRQVQKSSWRTFAKVAKMRGLSTSEARVLTEVVRRCRVKRPSQVLGSLPLFDKCLDRAIERQYITEEKQILLEAARSKLASKAQNWDGHKDRRNFERLDCSFGLMVYVITKEHLDEAVKSSYQETDPEFNQALEALVSEMVPLSVRVEDLSAGGIALRMAESETIREGDYVRLATAEGVALNLEGLVGRILALEHREAKHEYIIHLGFLPYDVELKRSIIQHVHGADTQAGTAGTAGPRQPDPATESGTSSPRTPEAAPEQPQEAGQQPAQLG